jgi:plasmid stability protein
MKTGEAEAVLDSELYFLQNGGNREDFCLMATLNVKNFPDALYDKIQRRAKAERRSISGEVVYLLERVTEEAEPLSILELRSLGKEIWEDVDPGEHVSRERDSWA